MIYELDGDTAVQRRCFCFAADTQSAAGASLRGRSYSSRLARARTKRPREAHSARTSPWIRARGLHQQQSVGALGSDAVSKHKITG